jgi:hypothetical protein
LKKEEVKGPLHQEALLFGGWPIAAAFQELRDDIDNIPGYPY